MPDWPVYGAALDDSGSITPGTLLCGTGMMLSAGGTAQSASTVWPAANLAMYYPIRIEATCTIYQLSVQNGATVAGNVDMGIYDHISSLRLVSIGSTAMSGATTIQVFNITDLILTPGIYYLAFASDSATATFLSSTLAAQNMRVCGMREQTSAFPLPSSATFESYVRAVQPSVAAHMRSVV